jgi:hypothetical protein
MRIQAAEVSSRVRHAGPLAAWGVLALTCAGVLIGSPLLGQNRPPGTKTSEAKSPSSRLESQDQTLRKLARDLLAWADEAELASNERIDQDLKVKLAEAEYQSAKLARELAELAATEYLQLTYPQDVQDTRDQIAVAEAELESIKDRLNWSTRMVRENKIPSAQNLADRQAYERARSKLDAARRRLDLLEKYDKHRQLKALEVEAQKARALELSKQATLQLERVKASKLRKQADGTDLSDQESRALVLLDEALQLVDQARAKPDHAGPLVDQVQTKIDEINRLVREANAQRAERREAQVKRLVHESAEAHRPHPDHR